MLTSRFPGLITSPWRECIKFAIIRNAATYYTYTYHELESLKWTPLRAKKPRASGERTKSIRPWRKTKKIIQSTKSKSTDSGGMNTTSAVPTRRDQVPEKRAVQRQHNKLSFSPAKKNWGTRSKKKSAKKDVPMTKLGLEVPEGVFHELIQTPIYTPVFKKDSLGRQYELRNVDCRPAPRSVRIYHPEPSSSSTGNRILYLPSEIPNGFFPPHDSVISTLSQITCSTIIYPVPIEPPEPFPQSIHNLLRIFDATTDNAPTAIITSGIAAATATAMAMTEPAIKAIGVWGGIFDLAKFSANSTRWNRPLERWEHIPSNPYGKLPQVPKSTRSPAIKRDEFAALRRLYFPNPETWLDPFASPLAFFRRSKMQFSRLNLTEIMGPLLREMMAEKPSYIKSDWEEEVFIYPRLSPELTTWNVFPPRSREVDFPKIRIVLQESMEHMDDVVTIQAKKFEETAKKGLTMWLKTRVRPNSPSNTVGRKEDGWAGEQDEGVCEEDEEVREGDEEVSEGDEKASEGDEKASEGEEMSEGDEEMSEAQLEAEISEGDEEMSEAQLEAEITVNVDKLAKDVTGAKEVNMMANWVKWALERPSGRN